MTQPEWSAELVEVVAGEVRRHRQHRGMSAQELSDACAELGYPIPRSVLANLENGRRNSVGIAELLVLGAALGVPPVALLFPVGRAETVPVLPDRAVPTWEALAWFTSEEIPETPYAPGRHVTTPDPAVPLYREHARLLFQWREAVALLGPLLAAQQGKPAKTEQVGLMAAAEVHRGLQRVRQQIRRAGLILPPLPGALSELDPDLDEDPE